MKYLFLLLSIFLLSCGDTKSPEEEVKEYEIEVELAKWKKDVIYSYCADKKDCFNTCLRKYPRDNNPERAKFITVTNITYDEEFQEYRKGILYNLETITYNDYLGDKRDCACRNFGGIE